MDVPVKLLARMTLASLDLPHLESDARKRNSAADAVPRCSVDSVDGADAASEDGSQDSLAVEVDAEVPSSMSSMDDDDDDDVYDLDDEGYLNNHTDDDRSVRFISI